MNLRCLFSLSLDIKLIARPEYLEPVIVALSTVNDSQPFTLIALLEDIRFKIFTFLIIISLVFKDKSIPNPSLTQLIVKSLHTTFCT